MTVPAGITALKAALKAEFAGDVTFHEAFPTTVTAPAVMITPGRPFLVPSAIGVVEESWEILVAVSLKSPDRGEEEMRDLSLRIMAIVQAAGGTWQEASGPQRLADPQSAQVVSVNRVRYKYAT